MKIILNGKESDISAVTVGDLVKSMNINPNTVVAEHNGNIVPAGGDQKLKDGDRLELIKFVGGG